MSTEKITISNVVYNLTAEQKAKFGFNKDQVTFKDAYEYWRKNWTDEASELLQTLAIEVAKEFNVKIDESDFDRKVDIDNLTNEQIIEISNFYANLTTELAKLVGKENHPHIDQDAIEYSKQIAKEYEKRGTSPSTDGHLPYSVKKPIEKRNGLYEDSENLATLLGSIHATNMFGLKQSVVTAFSMYSFFDKESKWGHLASNLNAKNSVAMTVANINGEHWFVNTFASETKQPINLNQDLTQLEAKLAEAQKQNSQAQTALTNAKAELAAASRKYASALEAKTEAEKELTSKTASPLQTEVAEKNLQLANFALKNAQERKATAEKAVENFSRSQAEKQTALETAKAELTTAKTAQKDAETALTSAQAKLQVEENKLTVLQAEQAKLHAEKDKLVSDAKAIATELSAYLNADKNLADEQAKVTDLEAKLTQAKSTAKLAQDKLDAVTAKLKAEQVKLAEIQEEFDKLVKAERKDYYNLSGWYLEYPARKQADKKTDTEIKKVEDSKASQAGNWIESDGRWWYKHADGSYTTNGWEQIKDKWYYFDQAGWMQTGWVKTGGTWYYLNKSGSMATDWVKDNGTWYYLNKSGSMATDWVKDNGTWYYLNKSGSIATGWIKDNGTWYYLNNSGSMATGWVKDNGSWYYLDKSGAMTTGWFTVSGKWYYAYSSGALAVNTTTPDGYKVNANGEWVG